ncbi:DEAD/DEAH box helicase [Lonepinella sp. MS14435]|uniref:DEAD/DEAH box helicase n=1 Tax=Lonepinella sp. MS14435 TaxID=3003618 RepID=UPI0036D94DB9
MRPYFATLKEQANNRAKESSLSILGISNPSLRNHLSKQMTEEEPFVTKPVFEPMFAWKAHTNTMEELVTEGLLSKEIVTALNEAVIQDADENNKNRYAFKKQWKPFAHQYKAWKDLLSDTPQSRIITSGTGSGKTECFMVPVLEDLYREMNQSNKPLMGVRALFLYPLNALISSQRERLQAWTHYFGDKIRYCLYNGQTKEYADDVKDLQANYPQEVFSRERMRDNPAPILVTNGTMLEYMLVRQVDAPILNQSQGALRWIILDEAHTYVGSQAAELALQLRRVMLAFGVKAENVRFVATSATIAGEEAESQLKRYLASLANIPESQIAVIGGQRQVPDIPVTENHPYTLDELETLDNDNEVSEARFVALAKTPLAREIRHIFAKNPVSIEAALKYFSNLDEQSLYRWLDLCTSTRATEQGEAFLKLRAHYFQRTLSGLWACIDPNCTCKDHSLVKEKWPFGKVYSQVRSRCECGAAVFELVFCQECNEPHLLASRINMKLEQWTGKVEDEFSLLDENPSDDMADEEAISENMPVSRDEELLLGLHPHSEYVLQRLDKFGNIQNLNDDGIDYYQLHSDTQTCCACGHTGRGLYGKAMRRALLGVPFYSMNLVPTVLEYCPEIEENKLTKPNRGRRLITFTDSRQGTAKMSIKMQQDAERSRLRGLVVNCLKKSVERKSQFPEHLQSKMNGFDKLGKEHLKANWSVIKSVLSELNDKEIKEIEDYLNSEDKITPKARAWLDVVSELTKDPELAEIMLKENRQLSPQVFDSADGLNRLARLLLLREFMVRPKNRNNLETQGLVKLVYPALDKITKVPEYWEDKGLSLRDWKDFLKISLDFYVRQNIFLTIERETLRWIGMPFYSRSLISPTSQDKSEGRVLTWVQVKSNNEQQQRLINLLSIGAKLDVKYARDRVILNKWLQDAWDQLIASHILIGSADKKYHLDFTGVFDNQNAVGLSLIDRAYICPITNKLLDTTFKGFTPYLPAAFRKVSQTSDFAEFKCREIAMPKLWAFKDGDDYLKALELTRKQIHQNAEIQVLREQNLWTDINDSAMEGGCYYTVAEHSAQQEASKLQQYEKKFKAGQKNILNCSTTMEMGVDIGGIVAVIMNNVPPHPANYLQRAGRAGRSKESRAISFTLCKDNPHDQAVFSNPKWAFETAIPAPYVEFSSQKLIQRHLNAFLLGKFLRSLGIEKDRTKLNLQWFYGRTAGDNSVSFAQQFEHWLGNKKTLSKYEKDLSWVIRGTELQSMPFSRICTRTKENIQVLRERWEENYHYLQRELASATKGSHYYSKLKLDLDRLTDTYLLSYLASHSFLPGYGFPTDIVSFDTDSIEHNNRERGNGSKNKIKTLPTRQLPVAIREYAPGVDIALDGVVYRSVGIALNWQKIYSPTAKEAQKLDVAWRCPKCGSSGYEDGAEKYGQLCCSHCDAPIPEEYQKKVIQPTGFVADYYRPLSNNIVENHFLPIQNAWVIAKGEMKFLPTPNLGVMRADPQGKVFHHSSGFAGKGYAICMGCGRAESMTKEGFPAMLNPEKNDRRHYSPKATNKNQREYCSGTILGNIHLGVSSNTDVFELVLRSPEKGLLDDRADKVIAVTLAVALRRALTEELGISTDEVQYSVRPVILNGEHSLALQLFDTIAGGAGFASSAPRYIVSILQKMIKILHCTHQCEAFCVHCLLEQDSRFDSDKLNRLKALEWLGSSFSHYLALPPEYQEMINGGRYSPLSLTEKLRDLLNQNMTKCKFILSRDPEDWDISLEPLRTVIMPLLLADVRVVFVIEKQTYSTDVLRFFAQLQHLGIVFEYAKVKAGIVYQAAIGTRCVTVATRDDSAVRLGESWLNSKDIVLYSEQEAMIEGETSESFPLEMDKIFAICDELSHVPLSKFGEKFRKILEKQEITFKSILQTEALERVCYSDRYLRTPEMILLLGEILKVIIGKSQCEINIKTVFEKRDDDRSPYLLRHNWRNKRDYQGVVEKYLSQALSTSVFLDIAQGNKGALHARILDLYFISGKHYQIFFDQGMGYWHIENAYHRSYKYSFVDIVDGQISTLNQIRNDRGSDIVNDEYPTSVMLKCLKF